MEQLLQIVFYYILFSLSLTYALWIFYLAVMNLSRAKKEGLLSKTALVLGIPVLIVGLIIDFIVNVILMTVLFLELPSEGTVSARLKRHNRTGTGWRKKLAAWFEPIFDPYDPKGDHI